MEKKRIRVNQPENVPTGRSGCGDIEHVKTGNIFPVAGTSNNGFSINGTKSKVVADCPASGIDKAITGKQVRVGGVDNEIQNISPSEVRAV